MTPQTSSPALAAKLGRRSFLAAAVATATVAAPTAAFAATESRRLKTSVESALATQTTTAATKPVTPTSKARFVGHQPGRLYLGQSFPGNIADAEKVAGAKFGVHRTFYQWTGGTSEDNNIKAAHAAGRLPWVSFKPPGGTTDTWAAIGAGAYDADIRARARRYAAYTKPVIATFHHEPTNDSGDGASWAAAYCRIYDIFKAEGALKFVSFVPIIQEWAWNPWNKKNAWPERFLTSDVMSRMPFLGIDCYQNNSGEGFDIRIGRVLAWMKARGFGDKMIGIAETSSSDYFGPGMAVKWWNQQYAWCAANTDKIAILSHFNHPWETYNWYLAESAGKTSAFSASLANPVNCRLA